MKILFVGEYSNAHNNLACGLRALGHNVTIASNGNHWLGYSRDIDLMRIIEKGNGFWVKLRNLFHLVVFMIKLLCALPRMRGYDIVQFINPDFLDLKAERLFWFYHYLRRHNKAIVLGVYGTDYYYVDCMINKKPLRYSPYYGGDKESQKQNRIVRMEEWINTQKGRLNREMAYDSDAIVACSYEYWLPYELSTDTDKQGNVLKSKLFFVPLPIILPSVVNEVKKVAKGHPLHVFIGINRIRASFKGADIMIKALEDLNERYPDRMELHKVENVPFTVYNQIMESSDVVVDQIYSYSPGMNALLAMSKGKIVVSGGEPECYDMLGEKECRPIINVQPFYESVYEQVEQLLLHPENVAELKQRSHEFVLGNHYYVNVAKQMEKIYESLL